MNKKINTKIAKIIALAGLCSMSKAGFVYGPAVHWKAQAAVQSPLAGAEAITTWQMKKVSTFGKARNLLGFQKEAAKKEEVPITDAFELFGQSQPKQESIMCEAKFKIGNSPVIPPEWVTFIYSDESMKEEMSIFDSRNLNWIGACFFVRNAATLAYKAFRFRNAIEVKLSDDRLLGKVNLRFIPQLNPPFLRKLISSTSWPTDPNQMIVIQHKSHISVRFIYSSEGPRNYARLVLLAYWSHLARWNKELELRQNLKTGVRQLIDEFLGNSVALILDPVALFSVETNLNTGLVAAFLRELDRKANPVVRQAHAADLRSPVWIPGIIVALVVALAFSQSKYGPYVYRSA